MPVRDTRHIIALEAVSACTIPRRCVAISPPPRGNGSCTEAWRGQARGQTGPARADHELAVPAMRRTTRPSGPMVQSQAHSLPDGSSGPEPGSLIATYRYNGLLNR